MYAFNSAAIFSPGHPYIESTTVLSDNYTFMGDPEWHANWCEVYMKPCNQFPICMVCDVFSLLFVEVVVKGDECLDVCWKVELLVGESC